MHPPASPEALGRKYRELTEKYRDLVGRLEGYAAGRSASLRLAVAAMHSGSTALALLDVDGHILSRNAHWNTLEGGGNSRWKRSGEDGSETYFTLTQLAAGEATALLEHHSEKGNVGVFTQPGTDRHIELRLERLRDGGGVPCVMAMIHDVTRRVAAEQELVRARQSMFEQKRMQAVGELASGIAHDLNNALHAMIMRLTRLRHGGALSGDDGANVDALIRMVGDTAVRIGRLQELARRRADVPREAIDLRQLIAETVAVARPELEERSDLSAHPVSIEIDLPPLPPVEGSSAELRHVFLNLLVNARDAMPRGGRVLVRARRSDRRVLVTVEDEGVGIPAQHLSRVFDPFFTTKGERGTGLGLSIAQGVMSRLGGSIAAGNRPEGGAVITLGFPVADRPETPLPPDEIPALPSRRRILVVDDDADTLEATRWVLEELGQSVECAPSGPEAIRRHEGGERFDLVLCDIGMPGMNGWQTVERLKAIAPETRILMLSGWALEIASGDPRRQMVAGVLPKPISADDLRKAIAPPHLAG